MAVLVAVALIAVPFHLSEKDDKKATLLLDGLVGLPGIFPLPGTDDERRVLIAGMLTDPRNRVWEVWNSGQLVGIFLLSGILPRIDAQAHFAFFDRQLLSRTQLIKNMIRKVFTELELQRLTVELPEHLTTLIRFARDKLGFRYEGEDKARYHVVAQTMTGVSDPGAFLAKWGSRRERAYWRSDKECWTDMIVLRLLRDEFLNV